MDRIVELIVRFMVFISRYSKALSKMGLCRFEKYEEGKPVKILLVGYNGARNTGADIRAAMIVKQLEEVFNKNNIEISIMTLDIDNFKVYFEPHIKLIKFSSVFFWDTFKACSGHHAAILCEGSTLKSKFANALTMFFCEAAGIMKAQNKPCLAYGSEVGDMDAFVEKLSKNMCSGTYFIARTQSSLERIRELGLQGHLGTDTAWPFDSENKQGWVFSKLKEEGWDGVQPILGVAAINPFWWPVKPSILKWLKSVATGNWQLHFSNWYFFSWSKSREKQLDMYLTSVSNAVRRYSSETDMFVVLIGMEKLDADVAKMLRERLGSQTPMFLSEDYDGYELAQLLRNLSLLITSRYHAQVLSMGGHVPTIGVSMDERLNNIFKELGFDDKLLYGVSEIDLGRKLYETLCYIEKSKEEIQAKIKESLPIYLWKYDDMGIFLKQFMVKNLSAQEKAKISAKGSHVNI